MEKDYPVLTLKERDHRWNLATALMKENGLDCLIVSPGTQYYSPAVYDGWLTNDNATGMVVFPLEG